MSGERSPASAMRAQLQSGRELLVVKVGSSLLIDRRGRLRKSWIYTLVSRLVARGGPAIVVSSGAIALGREALGLAGRPRILAQAQAAAAVGQIHLARSWAEAFARHGGTAAQVLLTLGDLEHRPRYLNARATLEMLLERGIVPIVNENDTVATEEIRFGDNDGLAARVAQLLGARLLLLLSDVDGLYTADPTTSPDARRIDRVESINEDIEALAGAPRSDGVGTGGMISKLRAARIATEAGAHVLLASGLPDDPLGGLIEEAPATLLVAGSRPKAARKQWLRTLQQPAGRLDIDAGALAALQSGSSLLAVGVQAVHGEFGRGDLVTLVGPDGPCGQGLCGYRSEQARCIVGLSSDRIAEVLDEAGRGPLVHRDDLVLF
ncbi:glutamate 5-kinase [Wenzhouxiangella sp. AB-CW3]|nr:glutamate 5-kinase [Wenzhouxiangella sp. AB-CW3]